jgi:hypothetical protein
VDLPAEAVPDEALRRRVLAGLEVKGALMAILHRIIEGPG